MKKRLHIATLGLFHNELVDYVITKRGADKIAIIYTERNEEELQEFVERYEEKGVSVISRKVDPWEYHDVLTAIFDVVSKHEKFEIEYNISCGTRVMTAAAHLAAIFTDSPVFFVESPYEKEEKGEMIRVEPFSVAMLTAPKKKILKRLQECGGEVESQKELGSRAELGVSSVSKHVNSLESAGYVECNRVGRRRHVKITDLGRTLLGLKDYRKEKVWGN